MLILNSMIEKGFQKWTFRYNTDQLYDIFKRVCIIDQNFHRPNLTLIRFKRYMRKAWSWVWQYILIGNGNQRNKRKRGWEICYATPSWIRDEAFNAERF